MLSCFLFYIGPNFYSILIHGSEEPHGVRAILQIVLLALVWFAGVSGVVKSRFFSFAILFTVSILVALLGIALLLMEDQHTAMRFLGPIVHCLGCLVGAVFGLYFKCLGINAVSGCLLGIISAALIMESIKMMFLMCVTLARLDFGLDLLKHFCLALFHHARWVLTVLLSSSGDDRIDIFFLLFSFMGSILINFVELIQKLTVGTALLYGIYFGTIMGLLISFIGIVIPAIANNKYERAYIDSLTIVSSTLFAAVGWYYFGLIGIPICTFTGLFTAGFFMLILSLEDKAILGNVTANRVLCITCRWLGAGIGSLLVPPLFSFFGLLASSSAKKAIRMFSFNFIKSIWQYTSNLGGRNDVVYGAFMWMKQNHEGLVGSFGLSLAMLIGVGSGALLGGLCGHAVLMLANHSYDARVAGWSLMVSGSVVGALSAYSTFGLKASVPVGAFLGCGITAAILLWRGGFNFKSYFQRTIQLGRVWEIFNRARMEH